MKFKEIEKEINYDTLEVSTENLSGDIVEKQAQIIADKTGYNLYKCSIFYGAYPTNFYYLANSIDDINDQTELYHEMYFEGDDGYTVLETCQVNFECLAESE